MLKNAISDTTGALSFILFASTRCHCSMTSRYCSLVILSQSYKPAE